MKNPTEKTKTNKEALAQIAEYLRTLTGDAARLTKQIRETRNALKKVKL